MAKQRYYYHAAPPMHRDTIARLGLHPGRAASYGPPAVYLFRNRLFAENYVAGRAFDVWRVDVTGLALWPDPEDPTAAVYSEDPIPASRLKYLGTYRDGEEIDA